MSKLFPCVIIVLSLGASAGYFAEGDWRRVAYWLACSVITASVTF